MSLLLLLPAGLESVKLPLRPQPHSDLSDTDDSGIINHVEEI